MKHKLTQQELENELKVMPVMSDEDIDFSDIPKTTAQDWEGAVRGKFYKPMKQVATVRLDIDVLAWLKSQGRGYQTRLNEILRKAMVEEIKQSQSH